jgi:glycosyltransferase involved in cell wall biosynthesis
VNSIIIDLVSTKDQKMAVKSILVDGRAFKIEPNRGTSVHLQRMIDAANKNFDGTVVIYTGIKKTYDGLWGKILYIIEEQFYLPILLLINHHSFLLSPLHTTPVVLLGCKRILILHDLMFMDNLQKYGIRGNMFFSSLYRSICISLALKFNNNRIVTVSETSKRVISDQFNIETSDITMITNHFQFSQQSNIAVQTPSCSYILAVTGKADHKNFKLLKNVFDRNILGIHLRVVGNIPSDNDNNNITYYSNLTSEELMDLYKNAEALVFPSLQEGFGIPLLEAVNFNLPIFCSDIPIFREIMEDEAHYFDPSSEADLLHVLSQFVDVGVQQPNYTKVKVKYNATLASKQMAHFFSNKLK